MNHTWWVVSASTEDSTVFVRPWLAGSIDQLLQSARAEYKGEQILTVAGTPPVACNLKIVEV